MNIKTCANCEHIHPYYDGEIDGVEYWDLYCTKHNKWVYDDETCDEWRS